MPYALRSVGNTHGNSDVSAYPIHENIDRKRFLLFFSMHKCYWSMALVLLHRCDLVDELQWVKQLYI